MSRDRLDRVANIAVVVAAAVFVASSARNWLLTPQGSAASSQKPLAIGQSMPRLESVEYSKADRTLLFFVHSQCHYCTDSMAFYQALVTLRDSTSRATDTKNRVALVALSREPSGQTTTYTRSHGVSFDSVVSIPMTILPELTGTPTIVAVDRIGKVTAVWTGSLDKAGEEQVKALLGHS